MYRSGIWFDFPADGELLISLKITSSFAPDVQFKITRMPDAAYRVYWRAEISREIFEMIRPEIADLLEKNMSFSEIKAHSIFLASIERHAPVSTAVLHSEQVQLVNDLLKNGLKKDVSKPHGLDGHSFELTLYGEKTESYYCWCYLPAEWERLEQFINYLVNNIAKLEFVHYGARRYEKGGESNV